MRLRSPSIVPDWLGYIIAAPLALVVVPAAVMGFAFAGLIWSKRCVCGPTDAWCSWFAWRPVHVRDHDNWPVGLVWLERVERRSFGIFQDTQYRVCV